MSTIVPEQDKQVIDVSSACYEEIRQKLVAAGTGGTIIERGHGVGRVIDMGEIVIRNGYVARHEKRTSQPDPYENMDDAS